jgi:hypothetical protein
MDIKLGFITAKNATSGGPASPAGILTSTRWDFVTRQGIEDIKSGKTIINPPLPPGVTISGNWYTSYGTGSGATDAALQALLYDGAVALIGSITPPEAYTMAAISQAKGSMCFAPSQAIFDLSNKINYPTFMRGRINDVAHGPAIIALFKKMNWNKMCLFSANEQYGLGMLSYMQDAAPANGIEFYASLFSSVNAPSTLISALASLRLLVDNYDCRIFLIHGPFGLVTYPLAAANQLNMLNNPKYAFVGDTEWILSVSSIPGDHNLTGFFGITFSLEGDPEVSADLYSRLQAVPAMKYDSIPWNPQDFIWYDSVGLFATAISNLLWRNMTINGASLINMIKTVPYVGGVSGPFYFDSNLDRNQTLDLIQFQTNTTFKRLGYLNWTTNKFISYDRNDRNDFHFVFAGGANTAARDGITVLDGDILEIKIDSNFIVLALIMGLFLNILLFIIVDALIYDINKLARTTIVINNNNNNNNNYNIKDENDRKYILNYNSLLVQVWLIIYSIIYGFCGVLSVYIIGFSAFSWSAPIPIVYNINWIVGLSILSIFIPYIGFNLAFYGKKYNIVIYESQIQTGITESSSGSGNNNSVNDTYSDTNVNGNGNGNGVDTININNNTNHDGQKYQNKNKMIKIVAPMVITDAMRMQLKNKSMCGQFMAFRYYINRWYLLSSILFTLNTLVTLLIIRTSLPSAIEEINSNSSSQSSHSSQILTLIYSIFTIPIYLLGILALFHFFPHVNVRIFVTIPFQLLHFGAFLTNTLTPEWSYNQSKNNIDSNIDNNSVTVGILRLVMCIVSPFLAFIIFLIYFDRLKISRNGLDLIVAKNNRQHDHDLKVIESIKKEKSILIKECLKMGDCQQMVNTLHPIDRDFVLALNLINNNNNNNNEESITSDHNHNHDLVDGKNNENKQSQSVFDLYQKLSSVRKIINNNNNHTNIDYLNQQYYYEIKIEQIINNPITLEIFKNFMIETRSVETLMALLDIYRFKKIEDGQLRSVFARDIYTHYLKRGSQSEVNISQAMLTQFEKSLGIGIIEINSSTITAIMFEKLEEFPKSGKDIFQSIEKELLKLLNTSNYPLFYKTPAYYKCVLILNSSAGELDLFSQHHYQYEENNTNININSDQAIDSINILSLVKKKKLLSTSNQLDKQNEKKKSKPKLIEFLDRILYSNINANIKKMIKINNNNDHNNTDQYDHNLSENLDEKENVNLQTFAITIPIPGKLE